MANVCTFGQASGKGEMMFTNVGLIGEGKINFCFENNALEMTIRFQRHC